MLKIEEDLSYPKHDRLHGPVSESEKARGKRRPQLKLRFYDDPLGQECLPKVEPGC